MIFIFLVELSYWQRWYITFHKYITFILWLARGTLINHYNISFSNAPLLHMCKVLDVWLVCDLMAELAGYLQNLRPSFSEMNSNSQVIDYQRALENFSSVDQEFLAFANCSFSNHDQQQPHLPVNFTDNVQSFVNLSPSAFSGNGLTGNIKVRQIVLLLSSFLFFIIIIISLLCFFVEA